MQNSESTIDNSFKQKFDDFEVTPPTQVWERISDSMVHQRKRRIGFWIIGFSSAASIAVAFLIGWQFSKTDLSSTVQLSKTEQLYKPEPLINQQTSAMVQNTVDQVATVESHRVAVTDSKPIYSSVVATSKIMSNVAPSVLIKSETPINQLASIVTNAKYSTSISNELIIRNEESKGVFTESDRAIIEANMLAMNSTNEAENERLTDASWAVGIQGSPVYHFDQPSFGRTYNAADDSKLASNGVATTYNTNVSGGVKVEYNTGNRFSIQSGINYAEVTTTGGEVGVSFNSRNLVESTDKLYEINNLGSWANTESLSNIDQTVLNTQTGFANMQMKEGATLASSIASNSLVANVTQNYGYQQQAQYIEVPMILRYNLIEKRIGMQLLGGINTNVLVNNAVLLVNKNDVVARGEIEGLRPLTFSSSLGIGVDYELTEKIGLSFEPTLKVQLNSLNSNSNFDIRPYGFGVFSGISYRF